MLRGTEEVASGTLFAGGGVLNTLVGAKGGAKPGRGQGGRWGGFSGGGGAS